MKNSIPGSKRDDQPVLGPKSQPKDPYRDRSQTYPSARQLRHKSLHAQVLPSQYTVTIDEEVPYRAGCGVLRIETDTKSTMPVFAVNGEPVAVGHGTIRVSVPVGTYCVEAQSTAGVDPVIVEVRDGAEEPVYFWEHRIHNTNYLGQVKHKFRDHSTGAALIGFFFVSLFCCAPFSVLSYFTEDDPTQSLVMAIFFGSIFVIATLLLPYAIIRRRRDKENSRKDAEKIAQPMHTYPWGEPRISSSPILVGAQRVELPPPDPSYGAIMIYFSLDRHLWDGGGLTSQRADHLSRLWIEPPRVRIDGIEHVATWGTWWYPIGFGKHEVEVGVEGKPVNADSYVFHGPMTGKAASYTIDIEPRQTIALVAEAHTYAVTRPGGIEIFQPRLWVEPAIPNNPMTKLVNKTAS